MRSDVGHDTQESFQDPNHVKNATQRQGDQGN